MYLLNCLRKIKYFAGALGKCPKNVGVAWRHWKSKDFVLENHFFVL